jgi:hypothetical protein
MVIYLFYLVPTLMLSLVLFCLCFLLSFSFLALITILCEIHIEGQPPDWEDFSGDPILADCELYFKIH